MDEQTIRRKDPTLERQRVGHPGHGGKNPGKGTETAALVGPHKDGAPGYTFGTNTSLYNNGRLITMTDGLGTENYSFDQLG